MMSALATVSCTTAENDAQSGAHDDVIMRIAKEMAADMTGGNGYVIFVSLSRNTKIPPSADDVQVLDANRTDGSTSFERRETVGTST